VLTFFFRVDFVEFLISPCFVLDSAGRRVITYFILANFIFKCNLLCNTHSCWKILYTSQFNYINNIIIYSRHTHARCLHCSTLYLVRFQLSICRNSYFRWRYHRRWNLHHRGPSKFRSYFSFSSARIRGG